MRTAIKIIEHAHRVVFRVFSPDCRQGCKSLSLTLHASTPATSEPKHIFLAELQKREKKRAESSGKTKFSNIFRHYFICFRFASTAFFSFRHRKKAKTVPGMKFIAFKVNYWMFYSWRNRDQWFRVKSKRIVCFMSVVYGAQFQL